MGIIASAGGLGAISAVLRDLPAGIPVPVVVFQHLSPQGSQLAERISRQTQLPTSWAVDGERIVPGEIKICPIRMRMEIMPDGSITVCPCDLKWRDRPLDLFLTPLAESFGARALAVVLTGMGSDGSVGAREIKDAGGTVLVQDEETALHAADLGTVQVYDPEADVLRYAACRGFDEAALADIPPIDRDFHSTCAAAIRTGEQVLATDIAADPRFGDHGTADYRAGNRRQCWSSMARDVDSGGRHIDVSDAISGCAALLAEPCAQTTLRAGTGSCRSTD